MPSVEWAIMRAPSRAYADLLAGPDRFLSSFAALRRVGVALLLVGATMATSATSVADLAVVLRTTGAWSFAVLIQTLAAVVVVGLSPTRRVPRPRAFDLLFAGGGPWLLWLAAFTTWSVLGSPFGRPTHQAMLTLAVPAAWTAYVVFAYCQVVLGHPPRRALWIAGLHQGATWLVGGGFFFWAVQGWPRLLAGWPWRP
jgi:hypothetical protein